MTSDPRKRPHSLTTGELLDFFVENPATLPALREGTWGNPCNKSRSLISENSHTLIRHPRPWTSIPFAVRTESGVILYDIEVADRGQLGYHNYLVGMLQSRAQHFNQQAIPVPLTTLRRVLYNFSPAFAACNEPRFLRVLDTARSNQWDLTDVLFSCGDRLLLLAHDPTAKYYLAQSLIPLPPGSCATCATVAEAFALLEPPLVQEARRNSVSFSRQGDWWFVEITDPTQLPTAAERKGSTDRNAYGQRTSPLADSGREHTCTTVIHRGDTIFVCGAVFHPQHTAAHISAISSSGWARAVQTPHRGTSYNGSLGGGAD